MYDSYFSWKGSRLSPTTGRLLVSDPLLTDMFFHRSVVLLAGHESDGSFGVIFNKPSGLKFHEVVENFPPLRVPLYIGGPVDSGSLFFIHRFGDIVRDSQPIMPGLYWGGNLDDIKEILESGAPISRKIRFFLGYSGWGKDQLDAEMKRKSWVVTHASAAGLMSSPAKSMWTEMVKKLGEDYEAWLRLPSDPQLN